MESTQQTPPPSTLSSANRTMKHPNADVGKKPQLEIVEVTTSKQLREFLTLPQFIYTDPNSRYVMPLEMHMKMMMGKLGTPHKHFWLAYANGKPVARLGAKVHKTGEHERLHFGFFECQEAYPESDKLLIEKAHSLYPQLEMMGPFHFRQEDTYVGVLVQGFEYDPYFMMPYNSPAYDGMLKSAGLNGVMDLFTYDMTKTETTPELIQNHAAKVRSEGYTTRALDPKKLKQEARIIARIFNEALSNNWGFEEFLDDQVNENGHAL